MRPEPGNRTARSIKRRQWNESPPVCIRIASHPVKDELDARSDGTLAGYRQVILRDLMRYYEMLQAELRPWPSASGLLYYAWEENPEDVAKAVCTSTIDALERARILVDAGLSLDEALVSVGLVKGEAE